VPGATHEEFAAIGAIGVGGLRVNIAFVDMVKTSRKSDFPRAMERLRWSAGLILQLKIGMECGEVQGDVGPEMRQDPSGELVRFRWIIVKSGDHEVGDFEPDIGFVLQPSESVENGLQVGEGDFAVEILGEGFQVNIGAIDVVVNVVEGFPGDVPVGDHDGFEAERPGSFADIDDVLAPDGRFVVSERNGGTTVFLGEQRHFFGS